MRIDNQVILHFIGFCIGIISTTLMYKTHNSYFVIGIVIGFILQIYSIKSSLNK